MSFETLSCTGQTVERFIIIDSSCWFAGKRLLPEPQSIRYAKRRSLTGTLVIGID